MSIYSEPARPQLTQFTEFATRLLDFWPEPEQGEREGSPFVLLSFFRHRYPALTAINTVALELELAHSIDTEKAFFVRKVMHLQKIRDRLVRLGWYEPFYQWEFEPNVVIGNFGIWIRQLELIMERMDPISTLPSQPAPATNEQGSPTRRKRKSTERREQRLKEYVENYMKVEGLKRPEAMRIAAQKEGCSLDTVERALGHKRRY